MGKFFRLVHRCPRCRRQLPTGPLIGRQLARDPTEFEVARRPVTVVGRVDSETATAELMESVVRTIGRKSASGRTPRAPTARSTRGATCLSGTRPPSTHRSPSAERIHALAAHVVNTPSHLATDGAVDDDPRIRALLPRCDLHGHVARKKSHCLHRNEPIPRRCRSPPRHRRHAAFPGLRRQTRPRRRAKSGPLGWCSFGNLLLIAGLARVGRASRRRVVDTVPRLRKSSLLT